MRSLYRSRTDRKLAGVIGGIAEYVGISSTILRVLFIISILFMIGMPLVFAYLILVFVVPNKEREV
ncbi:PspC domain-containing protein [Priestia megaterium]|nr:PspC domain-containing protein [Priestia megaterium]